MDAAQRFFARALGIAGHAPEQVTIDGHEAYPRTVHEILGDGAAHRCSRYKNIRIEQDHRSIKQHHYSMRRFGSFASAARFCTAFEEQRQNFRPVDWSGEVVSLATRQHVFQERWAAIMAELAAA